MSSAVINSNIDNNNLSSATSLDSIMPSTSLYDVINITFVETSTSTNFEEKVKSIIIENELTTKIFVICLIFLITIANILMGCELNLNVVWATCKKPIAPAIGLFTQFFIMPILSYCIARLILGTEGDEAFALGLFVTGCAPAGAASNFWTLLFEGNAHLSVTMTFISTVAALAMMPLWMNLLGYRFLQGYMDSATVHVPYGKIVMSLLALVLPLIVGVIIARVKPNLAEKARKLLRPFVIFVLAFVIIFGTISNLHMFTFVSWSAFIAGLLLPLLGFMFGCFSAIILRQDPPDVAAIAIETGIQNTGIAIMLLKISFPGIQGDVSALLPIIVACCTPVPLLACYGVHVFAKHLKRRRLGLVITATLDPNEEEIVIVQKKGLPPCCCDDNDNRPITKMECGGLKNKDLPLLRVS